MVDCATSLTLYLFYWSVVALIFHRIHEGIVVSYICICMFCLNNRRCRKYYMCVHIYQAERFDRSYVNEIIIVNNPRLLIFKIETSKCPDPRYGCVMHHYERYLVVKCGMKSFVSVKFIFMACIIFEFNFMLMRVINKGMPLCSN